MIRKYVVRTNGTIALCAVTTGCSGGTGGGSEKVSAVEHTARPKLALVESVGAQARRGTNPPRRIFVADGDMGIRQWSAEVLIGHETNFFSQNISINRQQDEAGRAASECRLQNLLICPTLHN